MIQPPEPMQKMANEIARLKRKEYVYSQIIGVIRSRDKFPTRDHFWLELEYCMRFLDAMEQAEQEAGE